MKHSINQTINHLSFIFRRQVQSVMIDCGLVLWLIKILEEPETLNDYSLEYSVALLMNLCLRSEGMSLAPHTRMKARRHARRYAIRDSGTHTRTHAYKHITHQAYCFTNADYTTLNCYYIRAILDNVDTIMKPETARQFSAVFE